MTGAADRIVGLYQQHAHAWDRARSRALLERPWLDRFAALLPARGAILDLGCGAGEPIARYLAARGLAVTGIDTAPAMIELCRRRVPGEWIVADMRALALGRRFDGLLAWDSFFHLDPDDQRTMFRVFASHAAERAALMFTSGPSFGEAIGEFGGEPLYHASLDGAEYRALLAAHGFEVIAHVAADPRCGEHTVWLARRA